MSEQQPQPVFPLDLLEQIADILDTNTQLSLCCVSKQLYSLTVKSIYRIITLKSPSVLVACCRTLATGSPTTAAAVRQFSITYKPATPFSSNYFPGFYSLIQSALQRMPHLQELNLLVADHHYIHVLRNTQFNSLRHFECYLPLTASLILFLNRHPSIVYLQVARIGRQRAALAIPNGNGNGDAMALSSSAYALPRVNLPKLEYFIGNNECVHILLSPPLPPSPSSPPLRAVFLYWDFAFISTFGHPQAAPPAPAAAPAIPPPPAPAPPHHITPMAHAAIAVTAQPPTTGPLVDTIRTLAQYSSDTINLLSFRRRGWNLDLVAVVAAWLPDVYTLIVTNMLDMGGWGGGGNRNSRFVKLYTTRISHLLTSFTSLRRLHIHCIDAWNPTITPMEKTRMRMKMMDTLDEDGEIVRMWGGASEGSLVECVVPYGMIPWVRKHTLWVPDPHDKEGLRWTYAKLYSNTNTSSSENDNDNENDNENGNGNDNGNENENGSGDGDGNGGWRRLRKAYEKRWCSLVSKGVVGPGGGGGVGGDEEEKKLGVLKEVILGEVLDWEGDGDGDGTAAGAGAGVGVGVSGVDGVA